jgi:hypothetical protein
MKYSLKTTADYYGEYSEGRQIRPERIAGRLISEQLSGMLRKLRMDGSIILERDNDNGIREEGHTTSRMPVRKRPSFEPGSDGSRYYRVK